MVTLNANQILNRINDAVFVYLMFLSAVVLRKKSSLMFSAFFFVCFTCVASKTMYNTYETFCYYFTLAWYEPILTYTQLLHIYVYIVCDFSLMNQGGGGELIKLYNVCSLK